MMALQHRLIEEVKLGGLLGALSVGMFLAGAGGILGLAVELYPLLKDPALRWGVIALLVPLAMFATAVGFVIVKLRQLERSHE
jgi:hypothetical protein